MAGIIGYGCYIPNARLRVDDIWAVWANPTDTPKVIKKMKGLSEKAITRWDEDSITMAIAAAKKSLVIAGISGKELNAIYLGTGTNPHSSEAGAPTVAESLGAPEELLCSDCQFSSKSGTVAMQVCAALADAGIIQYGLAIGTDALSRHTPPNDILEYSASSGAAAFIIGKGKSLAEIVSLYSYTTLTPDFFRLSGERYIKHAASEDDEFSWGYARHVKAAVKGQMKKFGNTVSDYDYLALSQPDGQLPREISREIGFSDDQITPGLISPEIGDCGAASALLSLAAILDEASAGQRILLVSYGFGAGCDVLDLKTTDQIEAARKNSAFRPVKDLIRNREVINYAEYLRQERKLIQEYV